MNSIPPELQTARSLWQQGQMGPALAAAMQALRLHPTMPDVWEFVGFALVSRKKWDEAVKLMALAVQAFPENAVLRARYALGLDKLGHFEEADREAHAALALQPDLTEARLALIETLSDTCQFDLALQESLKLNQTEIPETAAFCQGTALFLTGQLAEGMRLLAGVTKSGWRGPELPEWDGTANPNAHVVLYNSQGFGDLIQFVRYIPKARTRVGSFTLQVPRAMERLMRGNFPDLNLSINDEALPAQITHRFSLMSLACLPGQDFDPLPQATPYLQADPALVATWRERLAQMPRPHIGLVWSSPWQMNSPFRVVDFATLQPVIARAKPHLISLQMGLEAERAGAAGLFDASLYIKDFADSAALMSELDSVITLDSAPAHLAGALGRPVWTFLPFSPEWRWGAKGESCLWYPSMRLFRQPQPKGWYTVFENIAEGLCRLLA